MFIVVFKLYRHHNVNGFKKKYLHIKMGSSKCDKQSMTHKRRNHLAWAHGVRTISFHRKRILRNIRKRY
jgi:hypothetical protein